jgi:cytochrome c6
VRRLSVIAAGILGASALAGCNSEGVVSPTGTVVGPAPTTPTVTFPIVAAYHVKGDPAKGSGVFGSNCGSCHTLAAAHTTGTVGPNLDTLKPDYRAVTAQVTNGGASMPSFKTSLSTQQIADVAAYVVKSTGGTP